MKFSALLIATACLLAQFPAADAEPEMPPVAPQIESLDAALQNMLRGTQNQATTAMPYSDQVQQQQSAIPPAQSQQMPTQALAPQNTAPLTAQFDSPVLFVYEFSAAWCPSCRKLAPIVEEAAHKYKGFVQYIPVNVDKNQKLVQDLNIAQIPTVMVMDRSGRMLNRLVGLQQGQDIDVILDHYKKESMASMGQTH
ncbi:MAG: thioredoxin family protein [Candidatus Obscuribacterales bacterium]|nr:thioredoxin family protein [Candidatus Obscuribacterales bacterium]